MAETTQTIETVAEIEEEGRRTPVENSEDPHLIGLALLGTTMITTEMITRIEIEEGTETTTTHTMIEGMTTATPEEERAETTIEIMVEETGEVKIIS